MQTIKGTTNTTKLRTVGALVLGLSSNLYGGICCYSLDLGKVVHCFSHHVTIMEMPTEACRRLAYHVCTEKSVKGLIFEDQNNNIDQGADITGVVMNSTDKYDATPGNDDGDSDANNDDNTGCVVVPDDHNIDCTGVPDRKLSTGVASEDRHDKMHPPDSNVNNSAGDWTVDSDSNSDRVTVTCSGHVIITYNWLKLQLMHVVYVPTILIIPGSSARKDTILQMVPHFVLVERLCQSLLNLKIEEDNKGWCHTGYPFVQYESKVLEHPSVLRMARLPFETIHPCSTITPQQISRF